jgi:hypothetical protein
LSRRAFAGVSERYAAALAKLEAETARRRKEVLAYVEEALAKQR